MSNNIQLPITDKFIWDFWYCFDKKDKIFHVHFLNTDRKFVKNNLYHQHAKAGYAKTDDFKHFKWIDTAVFTASEDGWDNTSIWSGDLIKVRDLYLLYYTSRKVSEDDGFTQHIGLAVSHDLLKWTRVKDFILSADHKFYEIKTVAGENTVHAWRDPFLFVGRDGELYMLVAAKDKNSPINRKGAIALLRAKNGSFTDWESLFPIYSPAAFSEIELPQMYQDERGDLHLCFNAWAHYDFTDSNEKGGLYNVNIHFNQGRMVSEMKPSLFTNDFTNYYGFRLIPELEKIGCFSIKSGGIYSFHKKISLSSYGRNFDHLKVTM